MSGVFLQLAITDLHAGFLTALTPEDWHTLTALAAFMDRDRRCYPSLATLARRLGVSVSTVHARLRRLTTLTWQGAPVLRIVRERQAHGR